MDETIYKAVNAWNYYLMNFNSPGYIRKYFIEIFGEDMGTHFFRKFEQFCDNYEPESALVRLWCAMSHNYREMWLEWVVNNFSEFKK